MPLECIRTEFLEWLRTEFLEQDRGDHVGFRTEYPELIAMVLGKDGAAVGAARDEIIYAHWLPAAILAEPELAYPLC